MTHSSDKGFFWPWKIEEENRNEYIVETKSTLFPKLFSLHYRHKNLLLIKNSVPLCNGQIAIKKQIVWFSLVYIQRNYVAGLYVFLENWELKKGKRTTNQILSKPFKTLIDINSAHPKPNSFELNLGSSSWFQKVPQRCLWGKKFCWASLDDFTEAKLVVWNRNRTLWIME